MGSKEFKAEIEDLIQQKRDEIKALEATLRIFSGGKSSGYEEANGDLQDKDTPVDPSSLGVEMSTDQPTLAERVKSAVSRFSADQEFTVPHVEALLKTEGFVLGGKSPRSRLAMIMSQLESEGFVIRTAKPKGFRPHKFKLAGQDDRNFSLVK